MNKCRRISTSKLVVKVVYKVCRVLQALLDQVKLIVIKAKLVTLQTEEPNLITTFN